MGREGGRCPGGPAQDRRGLGSYRSTVLVAMAESQLQPAWAEKVVWRGRVGGAVRGEATVLG